MALRQTPPQNTMRNMSTVMKDRIARPIIIPPEPLHPTIQSFEESFVRYYAALRVNATRNGTRAYCGSKALQIVIAHMHCELHDRLATRKERHQCIYRGPSWLRRAVLRPTARVSAPENRPARKEPTPDCRMQKSSRICEQFSIRFPTCAGRSRLRITCAPDRLSEIRRLGDHHRLLASVRVIETHGPNANPKPRRVPGVVGAHAQLQLAFVAPE